MSTYDEFPGTPDRNGTDPRSASDDPELRSATRQLPAADSLTDSSQSVGGEPAQAPAPYAESSAFNAPAYSGSRYTAAPQTPAGYSFDRPAASTAAGFGASAVGASDSAAAGFDAADPLGYSGANYAPPAAPATRVRERRRGPGWGALVGATVAAALVASGGTVTATHFLNEPKAASSSVSAGPSPVQAGTTKTVNATNGVPDWQGVAATVSNTVVAITVAGNNGTSQGSGVIYDSAGHIITNNHVVQGAKQIQATLADGRIYEAKLTGTDPATDLAVIQLVNPPKDLVTANVGDSDALKIGQGVMAIGNPLGLSSTVTTGIVSALNRPVVTKQEQESQEDEEQQDPGGVGGLLGGLLGGKPKASSQVVTNAVQVDAAINPGNSGGPLFDEHGQVVGINSSIATASQGSNGSIGIGFAIPSKLAKKIADQIIASGKATHAYLGVTLRDGAASVGEVTRAGAKVESVESGSPAANAGLKPEDVITAIDGKSTNQSAALTGFVRQYSSGAEVTLTIIRGGQQQEVKVALAERADS
ncbi:Periplasmic serine endoprotease DegP precursor [Actinomyces bovis]|uniref:Periplasmic serine endoprotease DegP n=1 Tax=Actinomyces bovis TaxID=1658 RepID=A0ABY1VNB3_9ACTO|nr:trypsin-like peptidase domain-containing protein [Actinomyces bovis]SPT53242.1 Periplasmic serine endoprotease DegP precursor [Actinomyces bovis]VEG52499.1 Periplasmic serine endoprotease DegP precursor [Actinomyces israelii]